MPYDESLAVRLRAILGEQSTFVEKKMFGGLGFLKDGKMVFAAYHTGDLMVRVDPARTAEYTERGAGPAMMGKDRPMSPSWLVVPIGMVENEAELRYWTRAALDFHATLA